MLRRYREATLWHITENQRLLFRSWDDRAAVICYDTLSGDTHLLNPLAAATLCRLQQDTPLRLDALACHVAASLGTEADEALVLSIEESLTEFTARGVLAQTCPT